MNELSKGSRTNSVITPSQLAMVLVLSAMLALGFAGCENQKRSAKEPVVTKQIGTSTKKITDDKARTPQKQDEAVASEAAVETAVDQAPDRMPYNPIGKVDPFTPLYREEVKEEPKAIVAKPNVPERPRTPLEKLDLGQLKLTAIVTTQGNRRALVEEATGKGYVVKVGTRIGLERGAVVEIDQDRIVIEHTAEDEFGKSTSRKRELKLQKPPGD